MSLSLRTDLSRSLSGRVVNVCFFFIYKIRRISVEKYGGTFKYCIPSVKRRKSKDQMSFWKISVLFPSLCKSLMVIIFLYYYIDLCICGAGGGAYPHKIINNLSEYLIILLRTGVKSLRVILDKNLLALPKNLTHFCLWICDGYLSCKKKKRTYKVLIWFWGVYCVSERTTSIWLIGWWAVLRAFKEDVIPRAKTCTRYESSMISKLWMCCYLRIFHVNCEYTSTVRFCLTTLGRANHELYANTNSWKCFL